MKYNVPDWAKGIIWYQIYPERFRNGNPGVNPTVKDQHNSYPHDTQSPWKLHEWGSDWYKRADFEHQNKENIWYNIQRRRFGGDLQGIIDKLGYLKDLGIGGIYLNPVFDSPSHHKYDGATYHHIDPTFGPDPVGDRKMIKDEIPEDPSTWVWTSADKLFLKLIKAVHQNDMRIIIDGVFNHVGLNFWAFQDLEEKQEKSRFKDWFKVVSWDDADKNKQFDVRTWEGFNELPEWKESRMGPVKGPKEYIFNCTSRWMDPFENGDFRSGIDGWRLDVAHDVKHAFWKSWKDHVKSINPEAYTTGEVIRSVDEQAEYLQGDEFDAVMNYQFCFATLQFFISHGKHKLKASEFNKRITKLIQTFPDDVNLVMQNLLDSHDTNRVLSFLKNSDLFSDMSDWWDYFNKSRGDNPEYDTTAPGEDEITSLKLMVIFQFTFPGAPMIYYGDEVGMWGANDPCCRKPMLWEDIIFDAERYKADESTLEIPNMVTRNIGLLGHYKKLIHIHNENKILKLGSFEFIETDDEKDLIIFKRSYLGEDIIVVINNSDQIQKFSLPGQKKPMHDILNGETHIAVNKLHEVKARWACILKNT